MEKKAQIQEWIQLYSADLLSRAFYLVSNKEEAKDIVQEVFLAAYSGFQSFKGSSSPKTWLNTILKNKVADHYRKKYRDPLNISLESYFDSYGNWRADDRLLKEWNADSWKGSSAEIDQLLERCIEDLDPKWKIPIKLYYLQEKKTPEICQELDISSSNLWKILQRARLQLRECIEEKESIYE